MILWNNDHHPHVVSLATGRAWSQLPCSFKNSDIAHERTVIHEPLIDYHDGECLVIDTIGGNILLMSTWDPMFSPYLLVKEIHYRTGHNSYMRYFYIGFKGPDDLAILWKLSQ